MQQRGLGLSLGSFLTVTAVFWDFLETNPALNDQHMKVEEVGFMHIHSSFVFVYVCVCVMEVTHA